MLTAKVAARIISLVTTLLTAACSTLRCRSLLHRTGSTCRGAQAPRLRCAHAMLTCMHEGHTVHGPEPSMLHDYTATS